MSGAPSLVSIALLLLACIAVGGGIGPDLAGAGAEAEADDDEGSGAPDAEIVDDGDETSAVVGLCTENPDPFNAEAIWTICRQSENDVWISSVGDGGQYHAEQICASLGYPTLAEFGGNCGNECGYCEGTTSCESPGQETYDGGGECGSDANGPLLCETVTWRCTVDT